MSATPEGGTADTPEGGVVREIEAGSYIFDEKTGVLAGPIYNQEDANKAAAAILRQREEQNKIFSNKRTR